MDVTIRRAAVIGSGVMGSALAAHLANAGIPTLLLDIVPSEGDGDPASPGFRNALAIRGLKGATKSRPAAFFTPALARLITVGNVEDDIATIAEVDWVLEAIIERLDIKQSLFERLAPHIRDDAILTTNTSGLDPELIEAFARFGEQDLGKGVVYAKDTPNFIANRIGGFAVMAAIHAMIKGGYTVEEVDALTGPLLGRPKSASFRTADLVGIDVLMETSATVYSRALEDPWRDHFQTPGLIESMLDKGMLGAKAGKGFYKKVQANGKSKILTLDLESLEYRERQKAKFPSLEMSKSIEGLGERVAAVVKGKDRGSEFVWRRLSKTLLYAAEHVDEIAGDLASIDRAMRWGFGWKMGPFELWDAIGIESTVERMKKDDHTIPPIVDDVLASPHKTFYGTDDVTRSRFLNGEYVELKSSPRYVNLDVLKARTKVVKKNPGASLIDMGDGVLCLEFHTKMNAIGEDIITMIHRAVKTVERDFDALVIGNQGEHFSVGANIMLLLLEAQDGNWEDIDLMVRSFQKANMALKYCRKPVVAAPFGMTLAGGCEVVLGAGRACADAETYIGLVEVGVGLIPAAGGCKELLLRNLEGRPAVADVDVFPYTRAAFETIGMARVSTSALEARELKLLRVTDGISMNRAHLLHAAKEMAKGLAAQSYRRPDPTAEFPVAGESGMAAIRTQLYNMAEGGFISEYDAHLGGELARVLCGGEVPAGTLVSEQYLLDLEREVFLRLCGQRRTQERMQHMLKKGKPLRN
jgi:3-hydroxyacyl-CoA dehydrogenase